MKSKIQKIKWLILGVAILSTLFGCVATENTNSTVETPRQYVLNEDTKKVHVPNCVSAHKISQRNRRDVEDTISNILRQGYVICHNCNAGLKKSNIMQSAKDSIFYSNLLLSDIDDLPTQEEYLYAIDEMGKWYVNNIPTYLTELEDESLSDYTGSDKYIVEYNLKNKYRSGTETNKKYNVASGDEKGTPIYNADKSMKILKANEKAVLNYRDIYNKVDFKKSMAYYPCELLMDSADSYKKAGDDCVRFMFSVLNCADNRFTKLLTKYSKRNWSKINSKILFEDKVNVAYAMNKLGFEIYDKYTEYADINGDGLVDAEINKIPATFTLKKGDIISRNGHIHFYLGNGTSLTSENFGWGKVNRQYPQLSNINIESRDGSYAVKFTNLSTNATEYYTRVYRYKGRGDKNEK